MLENIKKMMGICNDSFDSIINQYINSGIQDLSSVGIVVDTNMPIIQVAIEFYVLSRLDVPNAELYSQSYQLQKDELRRKSEFNELH